MTNLINPVSTTVGFVMKTSARQLSLSGGQIATGLRGPSNIVDYVIGSKLRDNTIILRSVAKAAAYGTNMLKTAESTLVEVQGKLTNLKKIIAQANTADGESLERLNLLYKDGVKDILRLLGSAEFNGRKLFDGSLAAAGVDVRAQEIPREANPLAIRVGESINNNILINLSKLLAGKGNIADQQVEGRFTPLFPITPAVAAAVSRVDPPHPAVALNWPQINALIAGNQLEMNIFAKAQAAGAVVRANGGTNYGASLAAVAAARDEAKILSAGNLLNGNNQLAANNTINAAFSIVTSQVTFIGGQIKNLFQATDEISNSIRVQNEGAANYLNTDYENAAKKFKTALLAMKSGISMVAQGYLVPEATLELIME